MSSIISFQMTFNDLMISITGDFHFCKKKYATYERGNVSLHMKQIMNRSTMIKKYRNSSNENIISILYNTKFATFSFSYNMCSISGPT